MKINLKKLMIAPFTATIILAGSMAASAACTQTGFFRDSINMTAAMINPSGTVSGVVDATGCNIGVYYDAGHRGTIKNAEIKNADYFGVVANGDNGAVTVDVLSSNIHDIRDTPISGNQHGVAIYFRAFFAGGSVTGRIVGNTIIGYQKGGIVANGTGTTANISDNTVDGGGPVGYIARNGIQFGYGGTGQAKRNTVNGNAYTGSSTVSGGIIVVGGPFYGGDYCRGVQIVQNSINGNDIGVFLTQLEVDFSAPPVATNVTVINNNITDAAVTNGYIYQAGVSDVGNNDKIITNTISGIGYDPATIPGSTFAVDADVSFTNRPKVHANK